MNQVLPKYIVAYLGFGTGRKVCKTASIPDKLSILYGRTDDLAEMTMLLYA